MNKRIIILQGQSQRDTASRLAQDSPIGSMVTFADAKRTSDQSAKMWALLDDISRQVDWYGRKLSSEDWKHIFSASLKKQDVAPGIDGGFVLLGQSTSAMTKAEMSDLIELISAFASERGVIFRNESAEQLSKQPLQGTAGAALR